MNQENRRKITQLRHQLHSYPELSMQEYRTKDTLINFIKKETDLEVEDRGHWFYACYHCGIPGAESIAFRADFDALAIPEENDLPYCSRIRVSRIAVGMTDTVPFLPDLHWKSHSMVQTRTSISFFSMRRKSVAAERNVQS